MMRNQVLGGTASQRCGVNSPAVLTGASTSAHRRSQILRTQQHSLAGASSSGSFSSSAGRLGSALRPTSLAQSTPLLPTQQRIERKVSVQVKPGEEEDSEEMAIKRQWKYGRNEGPMSWPWKLLCAVLYMLPWVDVTEKTVFFIERFPVFAWTEFFTEPFEHWFYIHEWAPLIIFFGTYLGIVRNKKVSHVARFHIMLGVMLDIVAMILIVTEENLPYTFLWSPMAEVFYGLTFWFIFLMVMYSLFFCFIGWYCEIPFISDGVYLQIEQAEMIGQGQQNK